MGLPAAKLNDKITAMDIHVIMVPSPGGPVPTPTPSPFTGNIVSDVSSDVLIEGLPAATLGSRAINMPPHIPVGGPFMKPPMNEGKVMMGSTSVLINSKPAARLGDTAMTCNDPVDLPIGQVISTTTTVLIG